MGCIVFPAGVGNTEAQVAALHQTKAGVYVGTPDYLQTLLDHAVEEGKPLTHVKRALVSGGALFPAMRTRYEEQGIAVLQCYATADLGVIAYETASDDVVHPGMVVNEGLILEILVPGTSTPVAPGEVGEIVVTHLHPDYPLVRFGTGDLSRQIVEPSPCGRTNMRLAGWMGRADQRVKVRGMFVDPLQLAVLKEQYPEIQRWRVVVTREGDKDVMTLLVTVASDRLSGDVSTGSVATGNGQGNESSGDSSSSEWVEAVSQSLRKATNLGGDVKVVESLPDDGIVVEDQRKYD